MIIILKTKEKEQTQSLLLVNGRRHDAFFFFSASPSFLLLPFLPVHSLLPLMVEVKLCSSRHSSPKSRFFASGGDGCVGGCEIFGLVIS